MMNTIKNTIKTIAIAVVIGGGFNSASATELVKEETSKFVVTSSSQAFENYMTSKAKRFVRKNQDSWTTFNSVVKSYEVSNGRFQQMSEIEKANFYASTKNLKSKLAGMKGKEAQDWLKKVNLTESIYTFVWNSKVKENNLESSIQLPSTVDQGHIGR